MNYSRSVQRRVSQISMLGVFVVVALFSSPFARGQGSCGYPLCWESPCPNPTTGEDDYVNKSWTRSTNCNNPTSCDTWVCMKFCNGNVTEFYTARCTTGVGSGQPRWEGLFPYIQVKPKNWNGEDKYLLTIQYPAATVQKYFVSSILQQKTDCQKVLEDLFKKAGTLENLEKDYGIKIRALTTKDFLMIAQESNNQNSAEQTETVKFVTMGFELLGGFTGKNTTEINKKRTTREIAEGKELRDALASVTATEIADKLSVTPNPATTHINVSLGTQQSQNAKSSVSIYNIEGKKIAEMTTNAQNKVQFSTQNYPNGTYFVRYVSESEILTVRCVIQR